MRGTKRRRRYSFPLCIVPALGQVAENSSESPSLKAGHIFHNNVSRSKHANNSRVLKPQPRARPIQPDAAPGLANVLTWEPATDDIDLPFVERFGREGSYVIVPPCLWPM